MCTKISSGWGGEHCKNCKGFDQKRYNEPKINRIPDFDVFAETVYKGLFRHIWVAILILGPVKGARTSPSK